MNITNILTNYTTKLFLTIIIIIIIIIILQSKFYKIALKKPYAHINTTQV